MHSSLPAAAPHAAAAPPAQEGTPSRTWHLWPTIAPLGPLPARRQHRAGLALTLVLMAAYCCLLLIYLFRLQQTLGTHGEDLGIMDQVLWNTLHHHFWHQTICNSVTDTNCLGDVSRWAIHFEPLMLALVPLYALVPHPQTLQVVQVVGVALGALPAYWLGSRRFHASGAGVALAAAYLLMPVLRAAVVDDFHMVTLAAPLLMTALYCLYARNTRGLVIACLLALGTKEQIPLDVAMLGVAACLLQGRWRLGLSLVGLAVVWAVVALTVIHLASPLGESPTAERYAGMGDMLHTLLGLPGDTARVAYFKTLLANTGELALFAPWMLLLALPSALLNALSTDPLQYSGLYQYNADIAPFLLVAALEGVASIIVVARWASRAMQRHLRLPRQSAPFFRRIAWLGVGLWVVVNISSVPQLYFLNANLWPPDNARLAWKETWPQKTTRTQEAQALFRQIPSAAAVSTQANLVPHLSERRYIYQFPSGIGQATYLLLDVEGDYYPEESEEDYLADVQDVLVSGQFTLLRAEDGYLLLQRSPVTVSMPALPVQFCAAQPLTDAGAITALHLIGGCDDTDGTPSADQGADG